MTISVLKKSNNGNKEFHNLKDSINTKLLYYQEGFWLKKKQIHEEGLLLKMLKINKTEYFDNRYTTEQNLFKI